MNNPHSLEKKLSQFVLNSSCSKVIIGVSGGVDSAVTLAIAVNALGKEKVIALLLPYKLGEFSSYENFEDAKKLCEQFSVHYSVIELDEYVKPYQSFFTEKNYNNPLVLGNTLARIRMTLLFATANAENGLVLGTCNKTEIMLGYETKFGDGAADVSVIGNLWKKEVYALAKEYNLPSSFCSKPPSAELYINQSDEEEMGFSYDIADKTCEKIENGQTQFSNEIEQKIYNMYLASQHKRIFTPTL